MQEIFLKSLKNKMKNRNAFYNNLNENKKNIFKDLFVQNNKETASLFNKKLKEFIELQKDNDEVDLSYVCFKEEIKEKNFEYIKDRKISFANSIFEEEAYFTEFKFIKEVNFEGVQFKEITNFNRVEFLEECSFENVYFMKEVEFKKTEFKNNAKFSASRFKKFASFEGTIFTKDADFENSIAQDLFYFHNVKLGKLNLIGSHFDKANFLRLHNNSNSSNIVLTKENIANKDTARILKSHFDKENNITETNIYFVIEQEFYIDLLNKKESKYPNRHLNLITVRFNKYISNYGTDWLRVLIVLFSFGFLASLGYSLFERPIDIDNIKKYIIIFDINEQIILILGLFHSFVLYLFYYHKQYVCFLLCLAAYIIFFFFSDTIQSVNNDIITLINPLNIFNQDIAVIRNEPIIYKNINYFEKIALYGVIIKGIAVTLIYQFIISFRNSTRKK